jgi:8-oxo-dGTP diphosphatase
VRPAGEDFEALLQLRASWTDHGGTWGLPGGAADSHEDATTAAAREAQEEAGVPPGALSVLGQVVSTDHGDWRYTVVIAVLATGHEDVTPHVANAESDEVRWVRSARALELPLHAGLAATWEELAASVGELLPVG